MTRVVVLVAVLAAIVAAWLCGVHEHVTPERVAELVARAGLLGPLAFVLLFTAAEVAHVPGLLFVFAAAVVWPPLIAIPTAYVGALSASLVVFLIARHIAGDSVRARLPGWLLRYEARLESHGLRTVIALRLVLFLLPAVHWLLGASRVSFRDFFLGTALGLAPGVIAFALLGREAAVRLAPWLTS